MTLFEYLTQAYEKGIVDHSLRVEQVEGEGYGARIRFYIHPAAVDGDTPSFTLLSQGCTDVVLQPALMAEGEDESPLDIPSEIAADDEPPQPDGPDRLIHHHTPDGLLAEFDKGLV